MNESPLAAVAAIIATSIVLAGFFSHSCRSWHVVGATQGVIIGVVLFLCIPLLYTGLTGSLPVPPEFFSTILQPIDAIDDLGFVFYVAVIICTTTSIFFLLDRRAVFQRHETIKFDALDVKMIVTIGLFFHAVGSLWIFIENYGAEDGHWYRSREEAVERLGSIAVLSSYAVTGGRLIVVAMFIRGLLQSGLKLFPLVGIAIWIVFDMFVTGNRIGALLVMVGMLGYLIERRRFRILMIGVLTVPFIGLAFASFAFFRPYLQNGGSISEIVSLGLNNLENSSEVGAIIALGAVESVNLNTLFGVYNAVEDGQFTLGSSYLRSFVFLIPRSVWPEKPQTITQVAGDAFADGSTSLGVLFIGEALYSFGYGGPFVAPFFLLPFMAVVSRFSKDQLLARTLMLLCGFIWVRMPFDSVTLWTLFALIAVAAGCGAATLIRGPSSRRVI